MTQIKIVTKGNRRFLSVRENKRNGENKEIEVHLDLENKRDEWGTLSQILIEAGKAMQRQIESKEIAKEKL